LPVYKAFTAQNAPNGMVTALRTDRLGVGLLNFLQLCVPSSI